MRVPDQTILLEHSRTGLFGIKTTWTEDYKIPATIDEKDIVKILSIAFQPIIRSRSSFTTDMIEHLITDAQKISEVESTDLERRTLTTEGQSILITDPDLWDLIPTIWLRRIDELN